MYGNEKSERCVLVTRRILSLKHSLPGRLQYVGLCVRVSCTSGELFLCLPSSSSSPPTSPLPNPASKTVDPRLLEWTRSLLPKLDALIQAQSDLTDNMAQLEDMLELNDALMSLVAVVTPSTHHTPLVIDSLGSPVATVPRHPERDWIYQALYVCWSVQWNA